MVQQLNLLLPSWSKVEVRKNLSLVYRSRSRTTWFTSITRKTFPSSLGAKIRSAGRPFPYLARQGRETASRGLPYLKVIKVRPVKSLSTPHHCLKTLKSGKKVKAGEKERAT